MRIAVSCCRACSKSLERILHNQLESIQRASRKTTAGFRQKLVVIVCLFLPLARAVIAIRPMVRKGVDGTQRLYLINNILAAIVLMFFILLSGALITGMP
jgi:hypothetical protein